MILWLGKSGVLAGPKISFLEWREVSSSWVCDECNEEGLEGRWLDECTSSEDAKVGLNDVLNAWLNMVLVDSNLDDTRWMNLLESASRALVCILEDENEVVLSSVNVEWDEYEDEGRLSSFVGELCEYLLKGG